MPSPTSSPAVCHTYANPYHRNVNITGEKVDQDRVVLTLVPADGPWKVSHAVAI